jgi:hypothetical protein
VIIWHILDQAEADQNRDNLEREYDMRGTLSHPINFRTYAMYQHKTAREQIYIVPMRSDDIDEQ